jgi:acetyl esterase/lipase
MKIYFIAFLFMINAYSQSETIPLWGENIPNRIETDEKETYPDRPVYYIATVQKPTVEVFLPLKRYATGQAVVICPGGGYHGLAYNWEGREIAKWYNTKGIAAIVLKYRLPNSRSIKISHGAPLQDAQRAIRLVRSNAENWSVNPDKIGIMGFSAGGHLASTLGTHFDKPNNFKEEAIDKISARPNFMVLLYPVVTMKSDYTHNGSKKALLGQNPSEELISEFSNELQVKENTPPTFIVHAQDDKAVPVENSLQLYKALKDASIPTEMHLYPHGGHGFSLAIGKGQLENWPERLSEWLNELP